MVAVGLACASALSVAGAQAINDRAINVELNSLRMEYPYLGSIVGDVVTAHPLYIITKFAKMDRQSMLAE